MTTCGLSSERWYEGWYEGYRRHRCQAILCSGDCHVWLGSSSLCTCEAHRVAMYGHPMNYNPFSPHAPQPTPAAPDVPLARIEAAEQAGATHLSGDGKTAYVLRMGRVCWADWSEESSAFGGWWSGQGVEEIPAGAVVLK